MFEEGYGSKSTAGRRRKGRACGRSCQTLTFQHLIAGMCAGNRTRHHVCSRSWPSWATIPLTTQEEGDEVSCVDRDRTLTQGLLQALSHAALPGTRAAVGSKQTSVGAGLHDHEPACTNWCYWGPSSLPKSVFLCITY